MKSGLRDEKWVKVKHRPKPLPHGAKFFLLSLLLFAYLNLWWYFNFNFLTSDDGLSVVMAWISLRKKDLPLYPYALSYEGIFPQIIVLRELIRFVDTIFLIRALSTLAVFVGMLLVSRALKNPLALLIFALAPHPFLRASLQGFLIYPIAFLWLSVMLWAWVKRKSFLQGVAGGLATYTHPLSFIPFLATARTKKTFAGFLIAMLPAILHNIANLEFSDHAPLEVAGVALRYPPIFLDAFYLEPKLSTQKHLLTLLSQDTASFVFFVIFITLAFLGLSRFPSLFFALALCIGLSFEERYLTFSYPIAVFGVTKFAELLKGKAKAFLLIFLALFHILTNWVFVADGRDIKYKFRWFLYPHKVWRDGAEDVVCLKKFFDRLGFSHIITDMLTFFTYRAYFPHDTRVFFDPPPSPHHIEFLKSVKPKSKRKITFRWAVTLSGPGKKVCGLYLRQTNTTLTFPEKETLVVDLPKVIGKFFKNVANFPRVLISEYRVDEGSNR